MGEIVVCPIVGGGTTGMLIPKVKSLYASLVASQDTGEGPSCPLSRFPDTARRASIGDVHFFIDTHSFLHRDRLPRVC